MSSQPDNDLMQRFRAGDHRAFEEVFNTFYQALCFFTYRLIGDKEEARDVASEAMKKLWAAHQNFDSLINIKAFLYIAARNNSLNYLKSRNYRDGRKKEMLKQLEESPDECLLTEMIRTDLFEKIVQEMDMLPARGREIFKLFYLHELTIEEIASKLGMTSNAVRVNKSQALEKLRNLAFLRENEGLAVMLFVILALSCY